MMTAATDLDRDQLPIPGTEVPVGPDGLAPARPGTVAADMEADRPVDVSDVWDAWHRRKKPETVRKYVGAVVEFARYLGASVADDNGERIPVADRRLAPRPPATERETVAREALIRLCSASRRAGRRTVAEWVDHQFIAGVAPKTINQRVSALRSFVEVAAATGLVEWTLVVVNLPKATVVDRSARQGPKLDAVKAMLATIRARPDSPKQRRDLAVMELLCTTGLRRFQIAGATAADLDLENCTLTVARKRSDETEEIPLTARVCETLERWLDEYQPGSPAAPLFTACTKGGALKTRPMSPGAIYDLVRGLSIEATKMPTSPHRIRHTVATRTRERFGVSHASAQLGHEDEATTRHYLDEEARIRLAQSREAAEALGQDLGQEAGP